MKKIKWTKQSGFLKAVEIFKVVETGGEWNLVFCLPGPQQERIRFTSFESLKQEGERIYKKWLIASGLWQKLSKKKTLTICECADILNCSKKSVYRLINTGDLPALKIRTALRVESVEIENYIDRQREAYKFENGTSIAA